MGHLSILAIRRRQICSMAAVLCAAFGPGALHAQQGEIRARRLPPPETSDCGSRERLLSITLLDDATGAPVNDGTVALLRRNGGDTLQIGRRLPPRDGAWLFSDYDELPREQVRPGIAVVLVVRRPSHPEVRRPLTLGLDPRGCHLELRGVTTLRI